MTLQELKQHISDTIVTNGVGAITAKKHQALLHEVADKFGEDISELNGRIVADTDEDVEAVWYSIIND